MPSVSPGLDAGKVAIDMHEARTGEMARAVRPLARVDVDKIVAAIDDDEGRIVNAGFEIGGADECAISRSTASRAVAHTFGSSRTTSFLKTSGSASCSLPLATCAAKVFGLALFSFCRRIKGDLFHIYPRHSTKRLEFHPNPSCFWTAGISPLGHLKVESSNILGLGCVVNVFVCVLRINTNPDVRRVAGSKIHVPPIMHLCRRGEEAKVKTFCLRLVRPFWVWP